MTTAKYGGLLKGVVSDSIQGALLLERLRKGND
jgi:hypothetical protein